MRELKRLKGQAIKGTHPRKEKEHIMEKTTLRKIIKAVRELKIKESRNDSQFEFYNKKRRRIEHKERTLWNKADDFWNDVKEELNKCNDEAKKAELREKCNNMNEEYSNYYKQNKETLDFCYSFMDKIENENKVINNQIKQYLINYILTVLVEKLNKLKTFNYKKLDKIIDEISTEANKIYNFKNYNHNVLYKSCDYIKSVYLSLDYNNDTNIIYDCIKYFESHLTKKTITKKFDIDDFKKYINWDIKTPEQEAQNNATIESDLNVLKSKIEKLISDYNQERKKLTINQNNYKYMYVRQD